MEPISQGDIEKIKKTLEDTPIHPDTDIIISQLANMDQITFIKKAISYMVSQHTDMKKSIGYNHRELNVKLREYEKSLRAEKFQKRRRRKR